MRYFQCRTNNHPILRDGYIYIQVTPVQGNGLMIVEAPEWGTTYGVKPEHLVEVSETAAQGWLKLQRDQWRQRCAS